MTEINPNNNLTDKVKALLALLEEIEGNLSAFDDVGLLDVSVGKSAFAIARVMPLVKLDLEAIIQLLTDSETWLSLSNEKFNSLLSNLVTITSLLTSIRDCVCRTATATEGLLALETEDEDDCIFDEYISDDVALGVLVNPSIQLAQTPTYTIGSFPPQIGLSTGLLTGELNVVTLPANEIEYWRVKYVTDASNVYLYDGALPIPSEVLVPDTWYAGQVASGKAAYIDRTTISKRKKRKTRRYADFASRGIVAVWCRQFSGYQITNINTGECQSIDAVVISETNSNGTASSYVVPFTINGQGSTNNAGSGNSFITMDNPYIALANGPIIVRVTVNDATAPVWFVTEQNNELSGIQLGIDAPFERAGAPKYFVISSQPFNATVCIKPV